MMDKSSVLLKTMHTCGTSRTHPAAGTAPVGPRVRRSMAGAAVRDSPMSEGPARVAPAREDGVRACQVRRPLDEELGAALTWAHAPPPSGTRSSTRAGRIVSSVLDAPRSETADASTRSLSLRVGADRTQSEASMTTAANRTTRAASSRSLAVAVIVIASSHRRSVSVKRELRECHVQVDAG